MLLMHQLFLFDFEVQYLLFHYFENFEPIEIKINFMNKEDHNSVHSKFVSML